MFSLEFLQEYTPSLVKWQLSSAHQATAQENLQGSISQKLLNETKTTLYVEGEAPSKSVSLRPTVRLPLYRSRRSIKSKCLPLYRSRRSIKSKCSTIVSELTACTIFAIAWRPTVENHKPK